MLIALISPAHARSTRGAGETATMMDRMSTPSSGSALGEGASRRPAEAPDRGSDGSAGLGELVAAVHEIGERHGVGTTCAGHAGDGNLHPCFFYDRHDPASRAAAERAFDDLVRVAWALGGTLTGEHGVGSLKVGWLVEELGEAEVARQREVKALFDPLGIMNPGRGIA